jgi:hypothetical protein
MEELLEDAVLFNPWISKKDKNSDESKQAPQEIRNKIFENRLKWIEENAERELTRPGS